MADKANGISNTPRDMENDKRDEFVRLMFFHEIFLSFIFR